MPLVPKILDKLWSERIVLANRYYQQWEGLFKCNILERYYEGEQWRAQREIGYDPYVINKYYELIQLKIAKYIPSFPNFTLAPKPGNAEWDFEEASRTTQLKEDFLNTCIDDDRNHLAEEVEQAFKDSFSRFGMMEVGYGADWINNPQAKHPLLAKHTKENATGDAGRRIVEPPPELPLNERIYFKHISAKRFRIGGLDHHYLNRCGWVGYYEYVDRDDLLALKIKNSDKVLSSTGASLTNTAKIGNTDDEDYQEEKGDGLKIWKLWDFRSNTHVVFLDSPGCTLFERTFKRCPLIDFRPDRRLIGDGFYPVPPSYHWLSPQNEINETREQLRAHRRRFIRKFAVLEGQMSDEEIEKFETGPDGAVVRVKRENAIAPIENADLGASVNESIATSADDLNRISGTTSEEEGVSDRTTATQAKLVDTRSSIRGNKEQDRIVAWFCKMGREALLTARDKFILGTWAQVTSQEGPSFGMEAQPDQKEYQWITAEDLSSGFDFRIDVDLTSISDSAQDMEKKKMLEFLSILTQFPMVAFSPVLIGEIAYRTGYRNQKVIKEYQQMALLMELSRMNQLKGAVQPQQAPPQNGNQPQQIVAAQTPPGAEQIRQQMTQQLTPNAGS